MDDRRMIVAGQSQTLHVAPCLEYCLTKYIAGTIDTVSFVIPYAEHTVAGGIGTIVIDELGAPDRGRRIFVNAWLKMYVMGPQKALLAPQFLI